MKTLALLVLALSACAITPASGPMAPGPMAPAPAPAPMASSGGATLDAAEPIAHGQTVQGTVLKDGPRYYRIDLHAQESLDLSLYAQSPDPFPYATLAVLDRNGGKLTDTLLAVNQKTDWDVGNVAFEAKEPGMYIVRAECFKCSDQRVNYKIVVK
jgi:hypothetical protein